MTILGSLIVGHETTRPWHCCYLAMLWFLSNILPLLFVLLLTVLLLQAEISAHPQAVLDILQFHMEGPAAPPPPPKLPKKEVLGKE